HTSGGAKGGASPLDAAPGCRGDICAGEAHGDLEGGRMEKSRERFGGDRAALVGLTALMVTVTFLAYSPAAVPIIDDWTYAWSVRHLLQTGALTILEWSITYPIAQIIWGALWSEL